MCSISVVFLTKVIAQDNGTFLNSQLNSDILTLLDLHLHILCNDLHKNVELGTVRHFAGDIGEIREISGNFI